MSAPEAAYRIALAVVGLGLAAVAAWAARHDSPVASAVIAFFAFGALLCAAGELPGVGA